MTPAIEASQRASMVRQGMTKFAAAVFALLIMPVSAFGIGNPKAQSVAAAERNDRQQQRYGLCLRNAEADFQDALNGLCEVLCIRHHQQDGWRGDCPICQLPTSEIATQRQYRQRDETRCRAELKAGKPAPP